MDKIFGVGGMENKIENSSTKRGWKQDRTIARKARCCAYFAKQNRKKAELSEVGTFEESVAFEAWKSKQDRTIAREARCCAYFAKQNRKKAELSEVGTYKESEAFEAWKLKQDSARSVPFFAKQNQKKASFLRQKFRLTNLDFFKLKILLFFLVE